MIYNLSPILNLLSKEDTTSQIWKERIQSFFSNAEYDSELQDFYYDALIQNINNLDVKDLMSNGNLIDPYTGLFSFPHHNIEAAHSFNMARFISKNYQSFFGKKILTITQDFGILNIQLKLCGLNLVSSFQKEEYVAGSVLACIGNNSPPYPINKTNFPEEDTIFLSCVFQDENLSYANWEYMIDRRLDGKEVFFTSNTYFYLRRYLNYDKIELVMDPHKEYNSEDYANISYGYMNRIYRLK